MDNNQNNNRDNNLVVGTPAANVEFKYTCLLGMVKVAKTLKMIGGAKDFLLIRNEYLELAKSLTELKDRGESGVLVTGEEGIGKSIFLLYLLLHRLEQKLPTAIQFAADRYTIFDEKGASSVLSGEDLGEDERLSKCWALTDSNMNLTTPSGSFLSTPEFLIQMALPGSQRWVKQTSACVIVSKPPSSFEIAAIMKELGYNPIDAFHLIGKWGFSIRTIIQQSSGLHIAAVLRP
ncbi:hypothetical protein DFP72DRAFT_817259 [Ephemerocybe angulata]|uniref:Uncharacterized protein n=1 Tax=Ephemerocybe angulata TaxID=980116 RepID=A0A8H6HR36_9AGAR|nr:hypothetical protein DFP72DRAFT_817259 [Tulosesus angulatus]